MPTPSPNSRSWRTYSDVARILGLRLCVDGSDSDHRRGRVEYGFPGCVHWSERQITKRGLRRFLKLAALAQGLSAALAVVHPYGQSVVADQMARQLGVRFPRNLADEDRAKVRLWLSSGSLNKLDPDLKRRIKRWAKATPR